MVLFHTYRDIHKVINTNKLVPQGGSQKLKELYSELLAPFEVVCFFPRQLYWSAQLYAPTKDLNHIFSTAVTKFLARGLIVLRLRNVKGIIWLPFCM